MKLKQTKVLLASAALALAVPTTLVLSQDRSGQPQNDPGQRPQQQDRQADRLDGMQREQMSPEQSKQIVEKWFKNQASASQYEIEVARIALERLGTGPQPGMQGEQPRQPGAGGEQPAGGRTEPQNTDQKSTGAQHDQLRQLAQTMERDHTQALKDLRQRAQQEGVEISESPELEPVHRAKLDEIRQKQGEEFVRAFVFGNMASHTYAILELNWAQNSAPSQQIKEFAKATLPRIQQHAQQVAPLAYEIAGIQEARTAGERMERPTEQPPAQKPD
jgi:putative membrane protein